MVSPRKRVTIEGVMDSLIRSYSEGNVVGGLGAGEGKAAAGSRRGGRVDRVEIEIDMAVEVIDLHTTVAIKLRDVEV